MFDGPVKIAVGTAFFAFLAGSLLSSHSDAPAAPQAAPPARQSGLFGGIALSRSEPAPAASETGYGMVELKPDNLGQYHADVEIDGKSLPMLVDTGASFVALSYADAAAVGERPMPSDFNVKLSTANGIAFGAQVRLRTIRLSTIAVDDVPAIIMPQNVAATSLLGMSFLKKLGSFEVADGNLLLKP